ncbi:MAG: PAS domain S-box protein [Aliarcobacter sp.]
MTENIPDEIVLSQNEYNQILDIQQQILEMLASHYETSTILSKLCSLAESLLPNSVASIMLKDKKTGLMSILCAPSIPEESHIFLANLKPGPNAGSCGNAVFHNQPQYIKNTFEDIKWEDLRQVAVDFNICSCWSMPIRDKEKNAIGSFALSSFEHRSPNPFHKKLLETASSIVTIVLKNEKAEKRLKLFSNAMQNSADGVMITNEKNEIIEINGVIKEIYGYSKNELIGKNPKILASKLHDKEFYEDMWHNLNSHSKWSGEIINKRKDGSLITQWMSITALHNENNDALNYLAIFTDLTELKEAEEKTQYLAEHDTLTNLYNKKVILKRF